MPALANKRHEAYAQARARGIEGADAWIAVRPNVSRKTAYGQVCRFAKDAAILQRIAELTAKGADTIAKAVDKLVEEQAGETAKTVARIVGEALTQAEMLAWLSNAVVTPIGNLDGASMLTHSIETTSLPGPEKDAGALPLHKLKAHDKVRCIELAAKLQGFLVEKVEATVDDKRVKPPDERARLLRESIARRHATGGTS